MKKFFILILLVTGILLITGCNKKSIDLKDNYKIEPIESKKCSNNYEVEEYFNDGNQKVYLICLSDIKLKDNSNSISLKDYLEQEQNSISKVVTEFTTKLNYETGLFDGGTLIYKSDENSEYVDGELTLILCNTLEGNKDIYIGTEDVDISAGFEKGLCGHK